MALASYGRYYGTRDAMRGIMDDEGAADDAALRHKPKSPPPLQSLYDVFVRVRDDEAAHWDTLVRLVNYDALDAPDGCDVDFLAPEAA